MHVDIDDLIEATGSVSPSAANLRCRLRALRRNVQGNQKSNHTSDVNKATSAAPASACGSRHFICFGAQKSASESQERASPASTLPFSELGILGCLQSHVAWPSHGLEWHDCKPVTTLASAEKSSLASSENAEVLLTASLIPGNDSQNELEEILCVILAWITKWDVEVYMTCPGPIPIHSPLLREVTVDALDSEGAAALVRKHGLAVLKGCLSDALLDQWRAAIAEAITEMEAILVRQGLDLQNNDIFTFQEVAARGKHRFDLKLSVLDARFAVLMSQLDVAPWVSVIKLLLGEDVSRIASVIYSRPGADAQEWHADGPHMGPCAGPDGTGESQPYGACVFLPLHDLKACPEMGCTQFWPGTHKYSHLLGFGPAASEMHLALDALASPSEAVIYDYRTLHRGLANDSNQQREVLQLVYHVTSYSEGRNYRGPSLCENSCM